jgi:hypothetical protein
MAPIIAPESAVILPRATIIRTPLTAWSTRTRATIASGTWTTRTIATRTTAPWARPPGALSGAARTRTARLSATGARASAIIPESTSTVGTRAAFRLPFIIGIAVARFLTLLQPVGEKLKVWKLGRITHGSVRCRG